MYPRLKENKANYLSVNTQPEGTPSADETEEIIAEAEIIQLQQSHRNKDTTDMRERSAGVQSFQSSTIAAALHPNRDIRYPWDAFVADPAIPIPDEIEWYNPCYWPHRAWNKCVSTISIDNLHAIYIIILGNSVVLLLIVLLAESFGIKWPFIANALNNWKFQLANVFLLLSYTSSNILFLRIVLGIAGTLFMFWAATFPIGVLTDTFMWNYVQTLINLRHATKIFYDKRPIVFDAHREAIYVTVFEGIMSRADFKELISTSVIRYLNAHRYYCKAGDTCHQLSVLITGQIRLIKVGNKEKIKEMLTKKPSLAEEDLELVLSPKHKKPKFVRSKSTGDIPNESASPPAPTHRNSDKTSEEPKSVQYAYAKLGGDEDRQKQSGTRKSVQSDTIDESKELETEELETDIWTNAISKSRLGTPRGSFAGKFDGPTESIFTHHFEFLDSPEWIMRNTRWGKRYSITMIAEEDCCYLMWPREALIDLLAKLPHLETPLMGVLGIDVARKLFKSN